MSNFTKSIFFSGLVLVAGLIAVFSIYSNTDTGASIVSSIEPAAGETTFSGTISSAAENALSIAKIEADGSFQTAENNDEEHHAEEAHADEHHDEEHHDEEHHDEEHHDEEHHDEEAHADEHHNEEHHDEETH